MSYTSYYFNLNELRCKDGTVYPVEWMEDRWPPLAMTLDTLREAYGGALKPISGYRTEEYNRKIGGAPRSQHVQGRAADLRPVGMPKLLKDWRPEHYAAVARLHALALELHAAGKLPHLKGLGEYRTFVHVDTREGKKLARWRGKQLAE